MGRDGAWAIGATSLWVRRPSIFWGNSHWFSVTTSSLPLQVGSSVSHQFKSMYVCIYIYMHIFTYHISGFLDISNTRDFMFCWVSSQTVHPQSIASWWWLPCQPVRESSCALPRSRRPVGRATHPRRLTAET